jgi:Flp pilus assembly protein TadG
MSLRRSKPTLLRSQRGVALVFIVAAMAALLLMAGLALDVAHTTLDKSRLQNAADAAALAAAKMLDNTKSTTLATTEALIAFAANANTVGNQELSAAYANGSGTVTVTVQYSATLPPFTAGSANGPYVKVIANGFTRPTWLVSLAGIPQITVGATAVAGPSPSIGTACDLAPMMVCGNTSAGAPGLWGYTVNAPTVLKLAAPGGSTIGPGNFQLIQVGGPGANVVRQNMAGGSTSCLTAGNTVQTQTGNEAGPVAQGLDTRFGDYQGPMGGMQSTYPPDVIVTQPSPLLTVTDNGSGVYSIQSGSTTITASNINLIFNYNTYVSELPTSSFYNYPPPTGAFNRRVVSVPIGDCSGTSGGSTTVPVLGFACYFLLQEPTHQGNNDYVLGQFIGLCNTNGTPGPAPSAGPSPYIIQLYHDPSSGDS